MKVPADIWQAHECVMFHMTDLPYGRGGSPLQNLIVRGKAETKLTAFRCIKEIDAGPVYLKENLSLYGTADEIFLRATALSETMIKKIVSENIQPVAQSGEITTFTRRIPADSNVAEITTITAVYDHIRMLDGDGYPPAFLETEHFMLEFSRASLKDDCVLADIRIMKKGTQKNGE
ncbi:MAG: methionyl-tRNA formyltransferase [Gammaproteobacteria bacterium]|nr:methionyl-tRNA formyltransferase [Gammaproteobacteria bacterium]